jgi:hypothetical protein
MARKPTPQQASCIEGLKAHRLLKIGACAGSGKTSTLTMTAEEYAVPSLYLAFNKVTADEAAEKFPKHVTCKTTHSVAYAAFGSKIRDKLSRPRGGYVNVAGTGSEIGKYFKLSAIELAEDVVLSDAYLGLLVKTTVARFEQSADAQIGLHHIPRGELKEKAIKAGNAPTAYAEATILKAARELWQHRTNVKSPVLATHDTYLKMYQLSKPVLHGFDILYVDEFQDTTPCVMDIVMNQKDHMKVVMVGDARQAIYGWRGAVNAMKMVECEERMLTKSFRYGQAVADIATAVLEGAMHITGNETINSRCGMGIVDTTKPYTRLFRTNAALLMAAVGEIAKGTKVSIEIDVKDFVKLLESAVALYAGNMKAVKHDKVLPFQNWDELVGEAKHDAELTRISKLVAEGSADYYMEILSKHSNSNEPHITFTTAHKSKGREWSQVAIEGDFKSCYGEDGWTGLTEEEQNLLYVAVTRAIDVLDYNQTVAEYLERQQFDKVVRSNIGVLKRDMQEALAA